MRVIDFLGLIPARIGSKGVPKKNIKMLGAKPLIFYTIDDALVSRYIDELVLSTESVEIQELCRQKPIKMPFLRPEHLAQDNTPSIDVVIHCLDYYESINVKVNNVVLLQPTYPFRFNKMIDRAIEHYQATKADSLISVLKVPQKFNPHWVFENTTSGFLKISTNDSRIISRRQDLPEAYYRDGAIYITSVRVIRKYNSFFGEKLVPFLNSEETNFNIDSLDDWEKAELFLIKRNANLSGN